MQALQPMNATNFKRLVQEKKKIKRNLLKIIYDLWSLSGSLRWIRKN